MRASDPSAREEGRDNQWGIADAGAIPGCTSSSLNLIVETELDGDNVKAVFDAGGGVTPMMLAILATIWVSTGGDIASAYMPE